MLHYNYMHAVHDQDGDYLHAEDHQELRHWFAHKKWTIQVSLISCSTIKGTGATEKLICQGRRKQFHIANIMHWSGKNTKSM